MEYEKYRFWLELSVLLVNLGLWVWVYWSNRQKATVTEIEGLRKLITGQQEKQAAMCGDHKSRTTTLEVQFKQAPTHSDIGAVYDRIGEVKSSVDQMSGTLTGVGHQLQLLIEHHIKSGGGKE